MEQRYIITSVYEKDGKTPKHPTLIGRTGTIYVLSVDAPMYFDYDMPELKGRCLRTSWVIKFYDDEFGVVVYTENSIFTLTRV